MLFLWLKMEKYIKSLRLHKLMLSANTDRPPLQVPSLSITENRLNVKHLIGITLAYLSCPRISIKAFSILNLLPSLKMKTIYFIEH